MVLRLLSGYLQQYSELNIDFPQCGCAVWADIADAKREIIGDCMQRWWCWWGWDCGWDCSFGLAEAALAHGSRKLAVHSSADCSQVHFSCRIRRRWWGGSGSGVRGSGTGDRISDRSGSHWLGLSHAKNDKTVACPNPEPPEPERRAQVEGQNLGKVESQGPALSACDQISWASVAERRRRSYWARFWHFGHNLNLLLFGTSMRAHDFQLWLGFPGIARLQSESNNPAKRLSSGVCFVFALTLIEKLI